MAAELQKVTVRMSTKLFTKLTRLAEEAYESRDTYIESALAHIVREVTAAKREMREMAAQFDDGDVEVEFETAGQYL